MPEIGDIEITGRNGKFHLIYNLKDGEERKIYSV
jgi:hypothetical protein